MPVTDSIADLITRIRNAGRAGKLTTEAPASNLKLAIVKILKEQGYIADYEKIDEGPQGVIKIKLRYYQREPAIREIKRISKPGRRVYAKADRLPRINNGLGIAIISTSKGVMTDKEARRQRVGGEVLCSVW